MIFYLLMFLVGIEALIIRQNENDIYSDLINSTMNSCCKEVHADVGVLKDLKSFPELKFPVNPDTGCVLYCMFKKLELLGDDLALEKQARSVPQIGDIDDESLDTTIKHYNSFNGTYRFYKDRCLSALKTLKYTIRKLMNDIMRCYNENQDPITLRVILANQDKRKDFLQKDMKKGNKKLIHNQILYANMQSGSPEKLSENEKSKISYPQDEKELMYHPDVQSRKDKNEKSYQKNYKKVLSKDDEKGVNDALDDKEETELADKKATGPTTSHQHGEKESNNGDHLDDYEIIIQDYKDYNELSYDDRDDIGQSDLEDVDFNYLDPTIRSETTAQTTNSDDNRKSLHNRTAYNFTLNDITTKTLTFTKQGLQSQKSSSAIRPTTIPELDRDWHKSKINKSVNSEKQPSWLYHYFVTTNSLQVSKQDKFDIVGNEKISEYLLNLSKGLNKTSAAELQSIMNKLQTNIFRNVSVI